MDEAASTLTAGIKTMRLDVVRHQVDPALLYIQKDGVDLMQPLDIVNTIINITDPVTGELVYRSQSDIDREEEIEIEITAAEREDVGIVIGITINGWVVVELTPDVENLED
jgi:hypothetical protein